MRACDDPETLMTSTQRYLFPQCRTERGTI